MPHFNLQGDHPDARLRLIYAVGIKFSTLVLCGIESTAKLARMDASGPDRSRLRRRKQTYFPYTFLIFFKIFQFVFLFRIGGSKFFFSACVNRNYVRIMTESSSTLRRNSVRRSTN